ncbi:hypothetical protein LQZ19_04220 [Treponema primitia]|uniref:hypothetical protein n=1 Tax=Treponema primitia TaxID=88058 RepID=UPI00397EB519
MSDPHRDHEHEHTHSHEHVHEHSHGNTGDLNKLKTLLQYMLDHNREHASELGDLAHNLYHADQKESADVINDAVKDFEKGTEKLVKALGLIKDGK